MFKVQGSAKAPYTIEAERGPRGFVVRCSCPAGRRGQSCKHVAALLSGDVTNVIDGADLAAELLAWAEGTDLQKQAMTRQDPVDTSGLASIDDVEQRFRTRFETAGWVVARSSQVEPWHAETLSLHGVFKNGKPKKGASHELLFEAETADGVWDDGGAIRYVNQRPSARPWRVRSKALSRAKSFARLDHACQEFLRLVTAT